jgi:hypothetical protein
MQINFIAYNNFAYKKVLFYFIGLGHVRVFLMLQHRVTDSLPFGPNRENKFPVGPQIRYGSRRRVVTKF